MKSLPDDFGIEDSDVKVHTSSSIAKYNRCPKLWSFYYKHRVNPPESILDTNEAISVGSCIHEAFDSILTNLKFENDFNHEIIDWKKSVNEYPDHISAIAIPTVEVFLERTSFFEEITPVEVELELYADFEDGVGGYEDNSDDIINLSGGARLGGKIDAIVAYDNMLWVLDHKTSKVMPRENQYELHQQFNNYCWLARQHGYEVDGVIVNAIKQPSIKRKKEESFDDYSERIKKSLISKIDEKGTNQDLFRIFRMFKSDYVVRNSMEDIKNAIYHIEHDVGFRKNTGSCFFYRRPCEFFDVCRDAVDLQTLSFSEKEHPELKLI